jgi:hypothetical protein
MPPPPSPEELPAVRTNRFLWSVDAASSRCHCSERGIRGSDLTVLCLIRQSTQVSMHDASPTCQPSFGGGQMEISHRSDGDQARVSRGSGDCPQRRAGRKRPPNGSAFLPVQHGEPEREGLAVHVEQLSKCRAVLGAA